MKKALSLSFFVVLLSVSLSHAQSYLSVKGKLLDKETKEPLTGANISLINVKDSLDKKFAVTDIEGNFLIEKLDTAFYKLKVSFVGFKELVKFVRVNKQVVNVANLEAEQDTELLKELKIEGNTITATQNGDTTQYNAVAYKTNPDANAQDLITKMPGIIVDQSGVQAQGEQVQRVLVDGKEFFGDDPATALKSIPAEIIDKIEVFDQLSDQSQFSGFDDGNSVKTLNIVTKVAARNGTFGRAYAGFGTDDVYSVGGNINSFNDDKRISVVGMSNNINQQNFADEDILGVASASNNRRGGGGRGGRGGGNRGGGFNASGNANDFLTGQQSGLTTTNSIGINYSNKWDKLTLNGSYFYNNSDNSNDQILSRETFLSGDSSQFYNEISESDVNNHNHRLNLRLQYEIDKQNSIIFTPRLSFQVNDRIEDLIGNNLISETNAGNNTINSYNSSVSGFSQSGTLLFRHRFEKRGRTVSVRLSNSLRDSDNENQLFAITSSQSIMQSADSINQETDQQSGNSTLSTNITYTEPLWEGAQLQLNYEHSVTKSDSDNKTFDLTGEQDQFSELNTSLSNQFENKYITRKPTVGILWRKDKLMIRSGLAYQNANLLSDQLFPVTAEVDQNFNNLLPNAMIRLNFSKEKNLRFIYRTRTGNPSVNQLQNVVDNSNPLFLSTGNPSLKQSYAHTLITRYSSTKVDKSVNFFTFLYAQNTNNQVANATIVASQDTLVNNDIILPAGGQISLPVNVDGAWNFRSFSSLGVPLGFLKSNINFNLGFNYSRSPGLVNNQENISNTLGTNTGFVIGSNISEKVDFTISYNANYTIVENSLQPALNDNYFSQTSGLKLNWIFSKGLVFRSDISHQLFRGLDEDFNQDFFLWNMSIGKKILAKQRGEVRLDIFDLLNQNNNISRTTTETYLEDVINQTIRQYFMLSFTYNIRNFKKA